LKYAYPGERGGVVEVTVRRQADQLQVRVSDDGVGCPDEIAEGLGSRLVHLLVRQLKGTLERTSAPGGCTVTVVIPLSSQW
jgi:two-component sensor histidine kinase